MIVWNALVASSLIYVKGTCELPTWALKILHEILSTFLWRSKGNSIARQVLTGRVREGGFGLIDLGAKRDALRVKLIRKSLNFHG